MASRKDGRRSVSPHRAPHQLAGTTPGITVSAVAPGQLNILSTILRAPYPSQPQGLPRGLSPDTIRLAGRGQSPIRVITNLPASVTGGSPKSGLSPSRTPTTLPPKKSMSPSRPLYTERQTPSPSVARSTPDPAIVSTYSTPQPQSRTTQGQLLQHLPRLEQALQGNLDPEGLFHQYKGAQAHGHSSHTVGSLLKEAASLGVLQERRSPAQLLHPHAVQQPLPAHQRVQTPPNPTAMSMRRTPSPAHMPIGSEATVKVIVPHIGTSRPQAVNLVKLHTSSAEKRLAEAEYKPGDLLQSINRSQQSIQSHLQQSGLSPITPADTVITQPWSNQPVAQLITVPSVGIPHPGSVSATRVFAQGQGHVMVPAVARSLGISASALTSVSPAIGFTPVVLPSQSRQSKSPHSVSSAVTSIGISAGLVHSKPASSYMPNKTVAAQPVSLLEPGPPSYMPNKTVASQSVSLTEPGPPNITISSCSSIPTQDRPMQKHPRNPFTFPATPPVSLTNEKPTEFLGISVIQSKAGDDKSSIDKHRHMSDEMPKLSPVKKEEIKQEDGDDSCVPVSNAYNMRMRILAKFPNNPTYRPTYRATSVAIHKAKVACITNSAKSLDILRQNLQKSINKEIAEVIQKYMDKYLKMGIENIRLNNGDDAVSDDHVQAVCRQILEEAKKMYISESQSASPARDLLDNMSETGSSGRRSALGKRRHPSDTDSEASHRPASSSSLHAKKKKGKYVVNLTGRCTPSKLAMQQSKREGPKFDPERLTEDTMFVMGSKANKAMGFGATRGRLYMKHPELFKYGGDQDDKTWLYEHQHMPATGGKSYLVILDDVRELALNDEYRDAPGITVESLAGFTVPMWMIEKMRIQMQAMRTDLPKMGKYRSRSTTPNEAHFVQEVKDEESCSPVSTKEVKDLPFSSFSSPKQTANIMEASPADDELDFLNNTGNSNTPSQMSPFTMTGGFDDNTSQSETDLLDEETGKFGY